LLLSTPFVATLWKQLVKYHPGLKAKNGEESYYFHILFGKIFQEFGVEKSIEFLGFLIFYDPKDQDLYRIWCNPPKRDESQPQDREQFKHFEQYKALSEFEENIGIKFNNFELLFSAFTHSSMMQLQTFRNRSSYEVLEFLGDAVLEILVAEFVVTTYHDFTRNEYRICKSILVNNSILCLIGCELGFDQLLQIRIQQEIPTKIIADAFEAFLGALYLDKGIDYCRQFCKMAVFPRVLSKAGNEITLRSLSKLHLKNLFPSLKVYYKTLEAIGPNNQRIYTVAVYAGKKELKRATGNSIHDAELNAAYAALTGLEEKKQNNNNQKKKGKK